MRRSRIRLRPRAGFSLLEMMFATLMLLVGLVAVAQLVPASILLNERNRIDSSLLVFAQRELDQMVEQPIFAPTFNDAEGNACQLGSPGAPNTQQGSPVLVFNNQTVIDFGQPTVGGYSFIYQDPTDPNGPTYDVRWAVVITGNGSNVSSKRIILGARQVGGNGFLPPVNLDTTVSK
jgi:type II secretory pathway pseudopilin PulG